MGMFRSARLVLNKAMTAFFNTFSRLST